MYRHAGSNSPTFQNAPVQQQECAPPRFENMGGCYDATPDSELDDHCTYSEVNDAVAAASAAQAVFHGHSLEVRRNIINAIRCASEANAWNWAEMAVDETKMGCVDDKKHKNILCATRTPGVEDLQSRAYTGDNGLTLVEYAPFGVVAAITPSNNPAATIISNAIAIVAAGNAVVFAVHPAAVKVCTAVIHVLAKAALVAGAPAGLITMILPSNHKTTRALLAHPGVGLNLVTGGPAIVTAAMTIGKSCKTIAAGPGNPPVVVDETAMFPDCVEQIIFGTSFDNNLLCIAEKEVFVVEAVKDVFLECMRSDSRAFELSPSQMDELTSLVVIAPIKAGGEPVMNRDYVGRDAAVLAGAIGVTVSAEVRLLWGVVPPDHPLIRAEQLMPLLPVTFAADVATAIEMAYEAEAGNHHSASIYSQNIGNVSRMGKRLQCSIFVNNAATLYGLGMGEGYASMSIGTPTGDGITKPSHFVRPLHCSVVGFLNIS